MKTYKVQLERTQQAIFEIDEDELEPGDSVEAAAWELVQDNDWDSVDDDFILLGVK